MDNEAATLKTFDCKRCGRPLFTGGEFRLRIDGFEVEVVVKNATFQCACGTLREWSKSNDGKRRDRHRH